MVTKRFLKLIVIRFGIKWFLKLMAIRFGIISFYQEVIIYFWLTCLERLIYLVLGQLSNGIMLNCFHG